MAWNGCMLELEKSSYHSSNGFEMQWKIFNDDFYSYSFTGVIHDEQSSDKSDFEIVFDI